jgi:hypothetical protein
MQEIFISYASRDKEFAAQLANALEKKGYDVEWDELIPAGADFREHLDKRLSNAACIIVCWSQASVISRWVLEEAEEGSARGVLIPVLSQNAEIPRGFRGFHTIDLTDWDGEQVSESLDALTKAVTAKLGERQPPSTSHYSAKISRKFLLRRKAINNTAILGLAIFCFIAFAGWDFLEIDQGLHQNKIRLFVVGVFTLLGVATWLIREEPTSYWVMSINVIMMSVASMIINYTFTNAELGLDKFAAPLNIAAVLSWGIGVGSISFYASVFAVIATVGIFIFLLLFLTNASTIFIVASAVNLLLVGAGLSLTKWK